MIPVLRQAVATWTPPLVDAMAQTGEDPFRILIATLISLRTKDTVTAVVAPRLFAMADTPKAMLALPEETLAQTLLPAGFYRNKARTIRTVCKELLEKHGGQVPADLDQLLTLPGVGRKTANLVLTAGFHLDGICVDTHVHRIMNRWRYVRTQTPDETEFALRRKLPRPYWQEINALLVSLGQTLCHPTSPICSSCPVSGDCPRYLVTRSR